MEAVISPLCCVLGCCRCVCAGLSVFVGVAAKLRGMQCKPGTPTSPLMWPVHRGPDERGEVGDGLQLSPTSEAINNTQGAEGQGVLFVGGSRAV